MPTKPLSTFTFATDANFSSGPATGNPVKVTPTGAAQGYVPGDGIESETVNYLFNICGQWVTDWLAQGSNAADQDAHLVETDANGRISTALLTVGGHASLAPSCTMVAPAGGGNVLDVTGDGSNIAALFTSPGAQAALRARNSSTGPALVAQAIGTNNDGIQCLAAGSGKGIYAQAAANSSSFAVHGEGGNAAGSIGVYGEATHDDATAIRGKLPATASSSAYAVQGTGEGAGHGVLASVVGGGTGYALWVFGDTSSPDRAAMHVEPQDAVPVSASDGDVYLNDGGNVTTMHIRGDSVWRTVMANQKGFAYGHDYTSGDTTNNDAVTYTTAATAVVAGSGVSAPRETGVVWILISLTLRQAGASTEDCDIRLYDATAASSIMAETISIENASPGSVVEKTYTKIIPYTLPSVGANRNIELQFKKAGGVGTGITASERFCGIIGLFG